MNLKGGKISGIIFVLIAALVGLGYFLNIVLIPDVHKKQTLLEEKELTLNAKNAELTNVQELDRTFDTIKDEADLAVSALPSEKQIPDILFQFTAIADELNLKTNNLTISTTPVSNPRSVAQSIVINVSLTGSFSDLLGYLSALENSLRLINISSVSMSGSAALDDTSAPLVLSLQADAYFTPLATK
ncbi:hypothetical protein AUK40_03270 [Candidatus Wirthbacteria bacterium CG2_30_54_11]|uniref:Pilus assembly protein PilO n=1 Tax=Candidatus Wirthbacteria bacterium CG2_30_54_11 TaxID=1817892 RepID=A0A1J5IJR2_9BACT|nr:MAG: hypothetical protein AUK40_03270 [Candidatus Wirthbacteria bacterium CG2_30_54_11]